MKNKKTKIMIVAAALATCLLVGGISAYFTDNETATNTFTIGKVDIELKEEFEEPEGVVPGQEIDKKPWIENVGKNTVYVFMEVVMPYKNMVTANEDGTKNEAADTEIFQMLDKDGNVGINEGWIQVGTADKAESEDEPGTGTVTYVYAYAADDAMTALPVYDDENENDIKGVTPTLFDKVKFVNAVEGQGLEESTQNIVVNAYGIQATELGDNVSPGNVWTIIQNQMAKAEDDGE